MPVMDNTVATAAAGLFRVEIVRTWRNNNTVYAIDGLTVINETDLPGTAFVVRVDTQAIVVAVRAEPHTSESYTVPANINQVTRERYTIGLQWPSD